MFAKKLQRFVPMKVLDSLEPQEHRPVVKDVNGTVPARDRLQMSPSHR